MSNVALRAGAVLPRPQPSGWRARLTEWTPRLVLAPSLIASFVYVFVFTFWTLYISLSDSTLLPTYNFVGFHHYVELWANRRWQIAYGNLFFFGGIYVAVSLLVGLALAIAIDQRVRGESSGERFFSIRSRCRSSSPARSGAGSTAPMPASKLVRSLGWSGFTFRLTTNRDTAIYAIIITGVWQSSGFAMALFLAGLRSVDPDLIKAAQIDGASRFRIYRKVILPSIAPIFVAVAVVLLQFAIKTFDLVVALTSGGPGISTTFPALYVYDLMFQRGEIAVGAAPPS